MIQRQNGYDFTPLGQSISFLFPLTPGSKKGAEQSSEWSLWVNLLRECTDELEELEELLSCVGFLCCSLLFDLSGFFAVVVFGWGFGVVFWF